MTHSAWIYIVVMAVVSYLLRVLPLTLIKGKIQNPFVNSVLFYLPYVTLSVMIVPAIFFVTDNPLCGGIALAAACVVAWLSSNLFLSALTASGVVLITSLLL